MGYHLTAEIVSRGSGHGMVAKAAYNRREAIREERTGEMKDYSRMRDKPLASFVFVSDPELRDAGKLWNFYDRHETRKNAQLGYSFIAALPYQLTDEQREFIVKDFLREQFQRKGVAAQADIHRPDRHGDERNFHVHILVSMRKVSKDGLGERAFTWDDRKKNLTEWRHKWAERGARELEKAGFKVEAERWRYGHLTNKQQRQKALERGDTEWAKTKAREAAKHLGPAASAMERRGEKSDRGDINRQGERIYDLMAERDALEKAIQQEAQGQREPEQKHGAGEVPPSPAAVRDSGPPLYVQDILLSDRPAWWQRGALKLGRMSWSLAQALEAKLAQHRLEHEQQQTDEYSPGPPADIRTDAPAWPQPRQDRAPDIAPSLAAERTQDYPLWPESAEIPRWPEATEQTGHEPDIDQGSDIER